MRDSKIIIRVFYFIFLSSLFSYLTFISVHANTNDQNITIGQYEGEQSTSKSLNINANLIEIGAIEFEIYYDSNSFQVSSVSLSSVVRGEFNSINYSEPGVIKISLISSEGLTLKGRFMTVDFNVKSNATIGNHFWYVAVGTATNIDFEHQTIKATHGSFLVKERIYVAPNVYIYSSVSNNELEIGQVFSINFYSYNLYDMATGTFKFYYDNEYFKYNNTVFSTTLQNENSLIDINANQSGYINISYASLEGINYANPMFTIYFEVIKDTNVTSQIEFNAENLYNESLEPLNFIGTNLFSFKIREKTIEDEHSLVYLTSYVGLIKDEIFVNVKIEKDSMLAAGDFTILYDDSLLNIIEIDINDNLSANELLYTHIDYKNGSIRFSYINTNKLIDEITFITIKAKSKVDYSFETSLTVQGSGLKDENFNNLNLGFLGSNVNLTKGYNIAFYDINDNLIYSEYLTENTLIDEPILNDVLGYRFIGWDKEFNKASEDLEIRPLYQLIDYQINYIDIEGSINNNPNSYTIIDEITLSNPVKEGYTFIGWYDEDNNKITIISGNGNKEVRAAFEINRYEIKYYVDGMLYEEVNYDYNEEVISIATPIKEGYHFLGWDKEIPVNMPADNLEISGNFKINTYEVRFIDYDGSVLKEQIIDWNESAIAPDEPNNQEGYHFVSWDTNFMNVKETLEVKAIYEINFYEINYQIDENITHNNPLTYTINNSIIYLNNPSEKAGYNFIGWHDGENKLITSINPKILKDVNLYAKFELKAPKITLLGNKTINYGQALNISINVTHELSYTYETKWFKDGILISNDKELELLQVNESGSYQALVKIIINDTEINRNVDFNVNINRVKLNVSYENNEFTYNGLEHLFEAVIIGVIEGDDVSLLVSNNNKTDAETYTATLSLEGVDKDNYYLTTSQVIFRIKKAEVNINKDEIYLNINSKDINIESSYLNLSYKINDLIYEGNLITNLNENSRYLITIFIKESSNYLQSNELIFDVKTYLSFETLNNMFDENNVITIDTFYLINDIKEKISLLKDNDQVLINVKLSELINNYNVYIDYVNKEYEEIENFNNNIIKIVVAASSFTLMSLGFVLTIVRRKIIW